MNNRRILTNTRPTQNQYVDIIPEVKEKLVDNCDKRHRLIVGGRGKGASWSIARVLLLECMLDPIFVVCLREVQKTITHSVKKLLEDQIKLFQWEWFYKIMDTKIVGINGSVFVFNGIRDFNADNIKSLEGADRCWVAEAQTISRRSINILRPTIRKKGSVIWWDFNPRYDTDPVYVDYILNKDPNAEVLWISWKNNPWFTPEMAMEREADYLRDEVEAEHIWEGALRSAGDLFVCPSKLVDIARKNEGKISHDMCVGADIAHQGGDEIVFYKRAGSMILDSYFSRYQNTIKTSKDLMLFAGDTSVPINIDNGSVGAAVADNLEAKGFMVNRISFGGKPTDTEHYEDAVTEMYFNLRDKLQYVNVPNDDELRNQLIQRKYKYITGKRGYEVMKLESKDEFQMHASMSSKSPDRADALALAYYDPEKVEFGLGTISSHNYM